MAVQYEDLAVEPQTGELDTDKIREWRSIVTLIVFVLTNIIVLFPFYIPVYVPCALRDGWLDTLAALRIIPRRRDSNDEEEGSGWVRYSLPINLVTAPLVADLFLLALLAIGRREVHDGTIGADNISPIDIMAFFLTLAYIAISIDASGLIRYLAFRVLKWGGKKGHRLFLFLYAFFFVLGTFVGNDPVILSGTAFLSYMTRASQNIVNPRAWIYAQFACANVASTILVSSNPANLVLAGAFKIRFIDYTANVVVPVIATAIILLPFFLYVLFRDESLIPRTINMYELPEEMRGQPPVNPNIPYARGIAARGAAGTPDDEKANLTSLEEIMNPYLDVKSACAGVLVMMTALITLLVLNAKGDEHPVFWVALPAAVVQVCWDLAFGWFNRKSTREVARLGKETLGIGVRPRHQGVVGGQPPAHPHSAGVDLYGQGTAAYAYGMETSNHDADAITRGANVADICNLPQDAQPPVPMAPSNEKAATPTASPAATRPTLLSVSGDAWYWCRETFPSATTVLATLPWALVPFALCMFILVQGLVTKGWVPVFAYGWDHWVNRTGTVGAVGGMGFLSVILSNFAGTNIGTTILLSRVIQTWRKIRAVSGVDISDRTFWATVYAMAIGVNYGAFSTAFSASLAGLLWRDILARKRIFVRELDFARINAPIVAVAMVVGLGVLIGEVYIMRGEGAYVINGAGGGH